MITIRYAAPEDQPLIRSLDSHLPEAQFARKAQAREIYLLFLEGQPIGLLRYSLFWDSIPFCNLLFIDESHRSQGLGARLMARWEQDMKALGHGLALTSTQSDETAQHFYRRLGYADCGALILSVPGYAQPTELFLCKPLT